MGYICGGCGLFPWLASAIFVAEIGEYPDVSRSKSESQTGEQEFRSNIGCDIVGFICDGWDFMCFFLMDVILWALFMADVILWDLFARDLNLWAFSRCRPMWYCGFYLRQMVLCGLYLWQMGFCGGGGGVSADGILWTFSMTYLRHFCSRDRGISRRFPDLQRIPDTPAGSPSVPSSYLGPHSHHARNPWWIHQPRPVI